MRGAGVAHGPVHLVRVAIGDARDHELVDVSGLPVGAITNPPLHVPEAGVAVAVAYDSANAVLAAFPFDGHLSALWRRPLAAAGHLVDLPRPARAARKRLAS